MKTLITNLILVFAICSCSPELENEQWNPQYLIIVNFATEIVQEGGKTLIKTDKKSAEICNKIIKGSSLSEGYTYKTLCMGSDGRGTSFMYILLTSPNDSTIFLITYNNTTTISHLAPDYDQVSCLKRWIISQ